MEIRGERECRDCGTRWRYYDTGSVACPSCGSLVSVGVDERTRHTDAPAELDLSAHRRTADESGPLVAAAAVGPDLRAYRSRRGFVDGGDLLVLDDTYLAAGELREVADAVDRRDHLTDEEEIYLLSLLAGADEGDRLGPGAVPETLAGPRALADADAVLDYRTEVVAYLRGESRDAAAARQTLGRVADRAKRVRALSGAVPAEETTALVAATRDVWAALAGDGDDDPLARAARRLDALG